MMMMMGSLQRSPDPLGGFGEGNREGMKRAGKGKGTEGEGEWKLRGGEFALLVLGGIDAPARYSRMSFLPVWVIDTSAFLCVAWRRLQVFTKQ